MFLAIDFTRNMYIYGKCDDDDYLFSFITSDLSTSKKILIANQLLMIFPFSILSSILLIELCCKTFILFRNKMKYDINLIEYNDENEIIYSKHDIRYVFNLLKNHKAILVGRNDSKLKNLFEKYIYKWNHDFRFSSRFTNTIVAAVFTLYYFSMFLSEFLTIFVTKIIPDYIKHFLNSGFNQKTVLDKSNSFSLDFVIKLLIDKIELIKTSLISLLISSFFISLLICTVQLFLLVRECQKNLLDSYKGKCDLINLNKNKTLSNGDIAKSSFKFGG